MAFKRYTALWLFLFGIIPGFLRGEPLVSPTWGFRIDLPEGYQFAGGDGKTRFSFRASGGAALDIVVWSETYASVEALTDDVGKRLENRGETAFFEYRNKKAALMELAFSASGENSAGWGLCVELDAPAASTRRPLFLALAYGPAEETGLELFHLSALDSVVPSGEDRRAPGPVTEFSYPRGALVQKPLAGQNLTAHIHEQDCEAAQALVDREFAILRRYMDSPLWKEAWIRFYRAIYRDAFERLADTAFVLERYWNTPAFTGGGGDGHPQDLREFGQKALNWVQSFAYERNFLGSDFINPVSAAFEGRGDCDSRALLWAILLEQANIPAAIMVSREYSHAMGLADLPGTGAHFEINGKKWLVAETTAPVSLGLIGAGVSDIANWLGIPFEP
jgi:hypothetical protein